MEQRAKFLINLTPTLYRAALSCWPRSTLLHGFTIHLKNDETEQAEATTEEQGDVHTDNAGIQGKER